LTLHAALLRERLSQRLPELYSNQQTAQVWQSASATQADVFAVFVN